MSPVTFALFFRVLRFAASRRVTFACTAAGVSASVSSSMVALGGVDLVHSDVVGQRPVNRPRSAVWVLRRQHRDGFRHLPKATGGALAIPISSQAGMNSPCGSLCFNAVSRSPNMTATFIVRVL